MEKNDQQESKHTPADFVKIVQDAINTGDYQQLNEQVKKSVNVSVSDLRDVSAKLQSGLKEGMRQAGNGWQQGFREGMINKTNLRTSYEKKEKPAYQPGDWKNRKQSVGLPAVYAANPSGRITGTVLAILGYFLTGTFGISTLVMGIVTAVYPHPATIATTAVLGVVTAGSLVTGVIGTRIRGRIRRFRQYMRLVGDRAYCSISELAAGTGRTQEKIRKDLRLMIEKQMFLQGHLDQKETCLIVTDEMYEQYLQTEKQAAALEKHQKLQAEKREQIPQECRKILEEGQEYIAYIHKCNDDLPGEEISRKLNRLEMIITRIFQEVEKDPELADDLRKFMNYYLPTTRKLLDVYREMELDSFQSEKNDATKKEIEDTLDTINQAFENLLNSFFEERAIDISTDISVLHSMLAQEGLTKGDFQKQ